MFSFAKKLVDRFEGHATADSTINDSYFKGATSINNKGYGLRIIKVIPHSIAQTSGFESWFDYIIRINNHELPMLYPSISTIAYSINDDGTINYGNNVSVEQASAINYDLLLQEINTLVKNKQDLILDVWNAKGGVIRQIVIPLAQYEQKQDGFDDVSIQKLFLNNFQQIGLVLQSQHLNNATYVWRILNTHQGSPAFMSQLVPQSDYIIGCDSAFPNDDQGKGLLIKGGESLLSKTVLNYYNYHQAQSNEENIPITLYVYNHDYDILRPVTVNLSRNWGSGLNKGILGCDVGYGLLHRIPEVIGKFDSNALVEDILFENAQNINYQSDFQQESQQQQHQQSQTSFDKSNEIINQAPPALGSMPPPPPRSTRKKKHVSATNDGLSDYMNEELEKSMKIDSQNSAKQKMDDLPPPPPTTK